MSRDPREKRAPQATVSTVPPSPYSTPQQMIAAPGAVASRSRADTAKDARASRTAAPTTVEGGRGGRQRLRATASRMPSMSTVSCDA